MKMSCKKALVHGLASLLALMAVNSGFAQEPAPAAAPLLWKVDPIGQGATLGLPCTSPYEDNNGPLLIGDPLLDSTPAMPGFVANVGVGLVGPHLINKLSDTVTRASGASDTVSLPAGVLGFNAMPRVDLGYRWGQASGEALVSWTSLGASASQGFPPTALSPFAPAPATLLTRVNLQMFDLDYGSHEPLTYFGVDMKWRAGLRGIFYYSDSQAASAARFQHVVDRYWGLGPHAMVDFRRPWRGSGLELIGRIDVGVPFGRIFQRYVDTVTTGGVTDAGETDQHQNVQVLSLGFLAGVGWTPPWNPNFHVTATYGYQLYQAVGTVFAQPSPTETLSLQGCFLQAGWNF